MKKARSSVLKKVLLGVVVIVLLVGIWLSFTIVSITKELPRPERVGDIKPTQSTKIYDRTGEVLLYEVHGDENRTIIPSQDIPEHVKESFVAIEDQTFYSHSALDWKGLFRAFLKNVVSGEFAQGGSTITQQLAKNVFLTHEKTIKRKIKELILAYWIEQRYSKDEILSLYINQVSFGSNFYGIQAASQAFFGTDTKDLSISQAALLASVVQAPSYYSPWGNHKKELLERKNYTLSQMKKLGFIDDDQYQRALSQDLSFQEPNIGSIRAPHFVMMVKEYLENTYGTEAVENGGLRVITTLDWPMQEIAQKAVEEGAQRNSELYKGKNASLVAQDPKTGQILALVGSADFFDDSIDGQFNVATQGLRQPGSTFKPFAYLKAFEKGYTSDTVVFDVPTEFTSNDPNCPLIVDFNNKDKSCFHPQNFDNAFRGPVPLKQGLAQSINVPSVKTLYLAGLSNTIDLAEKMGITTLTNRSRYGLSLVLGGGEVHLVDLVNAYSVFSQDGVKHAQSFIVSVRDADGTNLEEYKDRAERIVESQYTRMINSILSDTQLRAGLFSSSLPLTLFDGYEVALKTGTTNDYRDAWTVGYTPFLVAGVWAGNSNYEPMQQQGGSILAAVPIWSQFMKGVINNYPPETFQRPEPILTSKPMLNGQYVVSLSQNGIVSPHIHTLLYYIEKNNPTHTGEFNPTNDAQFINWEVPVLEWAKKNISQFQLIYNRTSFFTAPQQTSSL